MTGEVELRSVKATVLVLCHLWFERDAGEYPHAFQSSTLRKEAVLSGQQTKMKICFGTEGNISVTLSRSYGPVHGMKKLQLIDEIIYSREKVRLLDCRALTVIPCFSGQITFWLFIPGSGLQSSWLGFSLCSLVTHGIGLRRFHCTSSRYRIIFPVAELIE